MESSQRRRRVEPTDEWEQIELLSFRVYMHIRKRSPMGKAFARVYSTGASVMVSSLWEEAA
jgi:hypothetical protein